MRRLMYGILTVALFALIPAMMTAQDAPPPPAATEEAPQVVVPDGAVPVPTAVGIPADAAPIPDAPASPVVTLDPAAIPILINSRTDLELLAIQQLGADRPLGWSGSLDITDIQLPILIRLDLELLAGRLIDPNIRPDGWFGAVPGPTVTIARDIRHDLELLADTVDVPNVRPVGWTGDDPLMRCDRGIQTLVNLLERGGVFSLDVDTNDFNFCKLAELQASEFAERNLLNGQASLITTSAGGTGAAIQPAPAPGSIQVNSDLAVAFLNRYGTQQVGIIPVGTSLSPVARSFTQFSRMTLVQGDNFEVFIDYRVTTMTDEQFASLPDVNRVTLNTACNAVWCKPVVYTLGNPASGRSAAGTSLISIGGRTRVPVENLIVYYDGGESGSTTVVRMQLCALPTAQSNNNCQVVDQVIAPNGTALTPVGNLNGMPQFRLPYGYSTHSARTANFYMVDIWISAPHER